VVIANLLLLLLWTRSSFGRHQLCQILSAI
jgi:hypothetical protein